MNHWVGSQYRPGAVLTQSICTIVVPFRESAPPETPPSMFSPSTSVRERLHRGYACVSAIEYAQIICGHVKSIDQPCRCVPANGMFIGSVKQVYPMKVGLLAAVYGVPLPAVLTETPLVFCVRPPTTRRPRNKSMSSLFCPDRRYVFTLLSSWRRQ